ncbi:MAG: hypothetical protein H0X39_00470 [Actinobacteria bacterium]|nr:hypothetical protein [Actinomycetota bacterium]
MSDELFVSCNGERLTAVNLTVSNNGPWIADVDFEAEPSVSGRVKLVIGSLVAFGTVSSGTFGAQTKARIVGGAGGWGTTLGGKSYANDAGIKALTIAQDAARAAGETIGDFVPTSERVGRAFVRDAGPGSRALEVAAGGAAWWVDYAGVTNVGPRPAVPLDAGAYQVLAYDPRDQIVTLGMDDPAEIQIGSVLTERLDRPVTVRQLEIVVTAGELRVLAWCGGSETGYGQLAGLLKTIAQRSTDQRLFGAYRYRVVRMVADRVELQAVRRAAGLPDLLPVSVWPGIAGVHAVLTPGSECLVSFIEGDRTQPYLCAFAGHDGVGFVPVTLTLGGDTGPNAARNGDSVEVLLPPAVFSGSIGGSPATGVLTFTLNKAVGVITSGSAKVRVA